MPKIAAMLGLGDIEATPNAATSFSTG